MNDGLYLFTDESGNFDFSPNGTKYLVFTCLATKDLTYCESELYELKHKLIGQCYEIEYFHAAEDKQVIRDEVFKIIHKCRNFTVDSVIVEKRKTNPSIRDMANFYPKIFNCLLRYALYRYKKSLRQLIIFTDELPVKKKRRAVEKALKQNLKKYFPPKMPYKILHHESKSHPYLQLADYCSWAIYVKWDRNELRPYKMIKDKVNSQFDIFQQGIKTYY